MEYFNDDFYHADSHDRWNDCICHLKESEVYNENNKLVNCKCCDYWVCQ